MAYTPHKHLEKRRWVHNQRVDNLSKNPRLLGELHAKRQFCKYHYWGDRRQRDHNPLQYQRCLNLQHEMLRDQVRFGSDEAQNRICN